MNAKLVTPFVLALALMAGLLGCKKDDAAVNAMKELTAQLSSTVGENNSKIESLANAVADCEKQVAEAKGEAAVITSRDTSVDVPTLAGEATAESLESLKTALNDAITKQKTAISDLERANTVCQDNLATVKEETDAAAKAAEEEAAAAKAAEEAAAKKAEEDAAAARKRRAKKRADEKAKEEAGAVKTRERQGKATSGMGSR